MEQIISSYIRDFNQNFLVLQPTEPTEESYEARMLTENQPFGLLKCTCRYRDGNCSYYYELHAKQPISILYEKKNLRYDEIRGLCETLQRVARDLEHFLLSPTGLLLTPDYIFYDLENREYSFCYLPGNNSQPEKEFHTLAEFILDKLDHKDERGVSAAYELYKKTMDEHYQIEDIMEIFQDREAAALTHPEDEIAGESDQTLKIHEPEMEFSTAAPSFLKKQDREHTAREPMIKHFLGILPQWKEKYLLTMSKWGKKHSIRKSEKKMRIQRTRKESKNAVTYDWMQETTAMEQESILPEQEPVRETGSDATTLLYYGENSGIRVLSCGDYGTFELGAEETTTWTIGKLPDFTDFLLESPKVSRVHARISWEEGEFYLEDLNSTNGTWLNGVRLEIHEKAQLCPGDEITIADIRCNFQ